MGAAVDTSNVVEPYCYLEGSSPEHVAGACRAAALKFLNGVDRGWTKRDLARWLVGPYAHAAWALPGVEEAGRAPRLTAALSPQRLADLLHSVRDHVVEALDRSPDGVVTLPVWALSAGAVMRSRHANGERGWIPVDWPRMRLEDRVMSLVAVDALVRPLHYETRLNVCRRCRAVSFSERDRALGLCPVHARLERHESGVQLLAAFPEPEGPGWDGVERSRRAV